MIFQRCNNKKRICLAAFATVLVVALAAVGSAKAVGPSHHSTTSSSLLTVSRGGAKERSISKRPLIFQSTGNPASKATTTTTTTTKKIESVPLSTTTTTTPTNNNNDLLKELASGLTVALAGIPSSLAFAAIAGVSPMVGVWSSVVVGGVAALTGMKPGLIAGAAGVVVVPLGEVVAKHGIDYILPCMLLATTLEVMFATLKGGRLIHLVTDPVMSGFLNGLGCLLLQSQLSVFRTPTESGNYWLPQKELLSTVGVTALTALLSLVVPNKYPSALVAIIGATVVTQAFQLPVATLPMSGNNNNLQLPQLVSLSKSMFSTSTLKLVAPAAISIAMISILETLLAVKVVQDHNNNKDKQATTNNNDEQSTTCWSLALSNAASVLMGGVGGCGLIPSTLLNLSAGGSSRVSMISYAMLLGVLVVSCSKFLQQVPVASLTGIMILVALNTIQWKPSFTSIKRVVLAPQQQQQSTKTTNRDKINFAALATATVVCYKMDMATGIVLGVLVDQGLSRVLLQ